MMQAIRQLQFSRFRRALLGAACDDGSLYLWDTNTKMQLRRFDAAAGAHHAPCTGLVFSPCNQMLLVSVGLDKSIICYDVTTNKLVHGSCCVAHQGCLDIVTLTTVRRTYHWQNSVVPLLTPSEWHAYLENASASLVMTALGHFDASFVQRLLQVHKPSIYVYSLRNNWPIIECCIHFWV
jgi:WD40 repeat protein